MFTREKTIKGWHRALKVEIIEKGSWRWRYPYKGIVWLDSGESRNDGTLLWVVGHHEWFDKLSRLRRESEDIHTRESDTTNGWRSERVALRLTVHLPNHASTNR